MKRFLLAIIICLLPSLAFAQCNGVFPNNTICGNITGSSNLPRPVANSALTGVPGGSAGQIQWNSAGVFAGFTMGGDCTVTTSTGIEICTKTNGVPFGTFATANAATPPAVGGTTPAAGSFTVLTATTSLTSPIITDSGITGSTQCVQANSSGVLSGQGVPCPPISAPQAGLFVPLVAGTVSGVSCSATTPFNCLQFCQFKGNQILVNGAYVTIPTGGCVGATGGIMAAVTKACIENSPPTPCTPNSTLANNTTYYVYVGVISSTPTLIFSTTAYNYFTSPNGNAVLSGDSSVSLVGLLHTDPSAPTISGSANQQNEASWFNSVYDGLQASPTGSFTAASYTNLGTCSGGVFTSCLTYVQFSNNVPNIHENCVLNTAGTAVSATVGIGVSTTGTPATLPSAQTQIGATATLSQTSQDMSGAIGSEGFVIANLLGLGDGTHAVSITSCQISLPSRMPS